MATTQGGTPSPFRCRPFGEWPADCRMLLEEPDPLDDIFSVASPWKRNSKPTRDMRLRDLGTFIDWLMRSGQYCAAKPIVAHISKDLLRHYESDMRATGLAPQTRERRLNGLYICARELNPAGDWRWIRRPAKKVGKLRPPEGRPQKYTPHTRDLVGVGLGLIAQAEDKDSNLRPKMRAVRFRDGLLTVYLALVGTRRGALSVMTIDKHLVRTATGFTVTWKPSEMKGGKRGYDAEIGPKLTTLFGRYLETYWPVLLGQAGLSTADARFPLWLSIRGTRMCESAIYKAVCRRTKAALGTAVNPHRFRHAIATTVAIELPEHTPIVTPLLGHLDEETAEQAYNLATSLQAGGRYGAALDALCFGTGEPDAA